MARKKSEVASAVEPAPVIPAFKGFDREFKCRGHLFEVGKTYTITGTVKACSNGFHACENPFDVWTYYPIVDGDGRLQRYAMVDLSGATDRKGDKIAAASITIKAEIRLPEFTKAAVTWIVDATKGKGDDPSGNYARIGASGNDAQIGASGNYARIGASGNDAQIGASGYAARIGASGNDAQIGASGNYAQIGASGNYARIGASGNYARIGASGNDARIGASGYAAQIAVEGANSIVASAGASTKFTGVDGTHFSLAWFRDDGKPGGFVTGQVGKDGVKSGVAYRAVNGKLVEVA